ncbi:MAG TPA: HK97 family phage prohead protease, partial [Geobacteraceae bacterium]|nr:HK97 family phage prohead protease [Geobacteraceae bacterium]
QFAPGAFAASIAADDVRCLFHHNWQKVLGRRSAGTLTLKEDEKGLFMECDPPKWAADIMESVERRDITGMSLSFMAEEEKWTRLEDGKELRTIIKAKVLEVSITGIPAYDDTDVNLRSAMAAAGIDPAALADAFARVKAGTATDADKALVSRSVAAFRGDQPTVNPSTPDVRGLLEAFKARVEVARRR